MTRRDAQGWLANALMEKVRSDRYPSATQLSIIEEVIPREMVPDYLEILIEKLRAELEQDFAARKAEREADIRKSAEALSQEMTRELERRSAIGLAELAADLAARERQGREALEATLGVKRDELDSEVSTLESVQKARAGYEQAVKKERRHEIAGKNP